MIIRRMLILLFVTIGFFVSSAVVVFVVSKKFREFVAVQILKTTWPEKITGNFADKFFQINHSSVAVNPEIFFKMGTLLESFKTDGYSEGLNSELCELHLNLKRYHDELKAANVPLKRLRSVAYQLECIKAIIDSSHSHLQAAGCKEQALQSATNF